MFRHMVLVHIRVSYNGYGLFCLLISLMKSIKEELVHYLWLTKKFDQSDLKTIDGRTLDILSFGTHNKDAGPDFLNARIELEGVLWAGHIEIHINASDWIQHGHGDDPQYQNVILHVVMNADIQISLSDGTTIPCLDLGQRVDQQIIAQYHYLQNNTAWIPCQDLIQTVDEVTKQQTRDSQLVLRLSGKASGILHDLHNQVNNWPQLVYQRIARSFGLKVNAIPMDLLAQAIPWAIVREHREDLHVLEALFFGQSGLLPIHPKHEYVQGLKMTYIEMNNSLGLKPLNKVVWKFARMRPAGFPTLRIAQLCKWLHLHKDLVERFFQLEPVVIKDSFSLDLSGFWQDHYRFGVSSHNGRKSLGKATKDLIMINAIAPLFFAKGLAQHQQSLKEKAITVLEGVQSERNRIIKRWSSLGMHSNSAADSQALLQLKKHSCDQHQCISCPIGHKVMSQTK